MSAVIISAVSVYPGQVDVIVSGGTAPYTVYIGTQTYSLSTAGGELDVSGLVGGSYSVYSVDSLGVNSSQIQLNVAQDVIASVGIPSTDTYVQAFGNQVNQNISVVLPVGIALLAVILTVKLIPKIIFIFFGERR